MMLARGSLRSFLETAKTTLQNAILNQQRVTLVIGNESADLDSITSAIVLAYLRTNSLPVTPLTNTSSNRHATPSQYPPFYIPVLNIPRADVKIRPELLKLLPYANLEPDHLITLDDLSVTAPAGLNPDGRENLQPRMTDLLLTDHNKLAGPLAANFSDQVIGCIDHHVDEHVIPDTPPNNEPRIIRTTGSCSSLVVQYCRPLWDRLSQCSSKSSAQGDSLANQSSSDDNTALNQIWDAQIARLALASILIDTNCLRDENKTVDTDIEAVSYLEAKIKAAEPPPSSPGAHHDKDPKSPDLSAAYDRNSYYTEINTAKSDLSSLTLPEILRKDYKQWNDILNVGTNTKVNLGISSVVKSLEWQVDKAQQHDQEVDNNAGDRKISDSFQQAISKFAQDMDINIHAIMTTSKSTQGKFQRELLLRSVSPVSSSSSPSSAESLPSTSDSSQTSVKSKEINEIVLHRFEQEYGEALGLEDWSAGSDSNKSILQNNDTNNDNKTDPAGGSSQEVMKIWYVRRAENSRKQVAPMLRRCIEGSGSSSNVAGKL